MLGGLNNYVAQKSEEPENKKFGYGDIWLVKSDTAMTSHEAGAIVEPQVSAEHNAALAEALSKHNSLGQTLEEARGGDRKAVAALKNDFHVKNEKQIVELPDELNKHIREHGGKFGVQNLSADEATADAQYQRLEQTVDRMREQYANFSHAEVHQIDYGNGKRVAVVMGIDANEFNSIRAAEAEHQKLGQTVQSALLGEKSPEKELIQAPDGMKDKIAQLEAKYPKVQAEAQHDSSTEIASPMTTPGQPGKGGRGVAA